MKVVIIGGVAGGATAAARIRRLDESAEIIIFERSGYISYANCGLPYYIGGEIEKPEALTLQTPESFFSRFRITAKVRHEVTGINTAEKYVIVTELDTGREFVETYDKLLLAPGAKPVKPDLPGIDLDGIYTLRTVEDTLRLREVIEQRGVKRAAVIGGGFVGIEAAENLAKRGIEVTIVEKASQVLTSFDSDMVSFIHAKLRAKGIKLILGAGVNGFEAADGGIRVSVETGQTVECDMVLLSIGTTPETALAGEAGLKLWKRGIYVDNRMRTSAEDIYAVGDAVEIYHRVTGRAAVVPLAGPANKQARIAADNICGRNSVYLGAVGSSIIKLFDMTAASTGINERTAKELGIKYDKIVLSPASHASYYPGGKVMTMKVLWDTESGYLLGAQIVGYDGVDKRIDVIATVIQSGMQPEEMADLELAYAPPYSSAKDPVNIAGYMIENITYGVMEQFHYEDIEKLPRDGSVTLLDTRTEREYSRGHVPGFINIPVDELRGRVGELDPGKPVYVMCQSGLRSYIACRILSGLGFDCYNFSGGYRFYESITKEKEAARTAMPCGAEE